MERAVAVKRLSKMLGKGFAYEVNANAPSASERETAKQLDRELTAKRDEVQKALSNRREALLRADTEYQRLMAAYKEADKERAKNAGKIYSYKFQVGTVDRLGGLGNVFHVKASGDSWEEIFAKLAKERVS